MKKRLTLLCIALLVLPMLVSCTSLSQAQLGGEYIAVNPPVDSGEMVIARLVFKGDKVTMLSGNTQQTVSYAIRDQYFHLNTKYGSFSYSFAQKDDNIIVIDGVDYRKKHGNQLCKYLFNGELHATIIRRFLQKQ